MHLTENLKLRIVPEDIENTFETTILKIDENNIYFDLENNILPANQIFDAYAINENGIIFFSTKLDKIENNIAQFSNQIKIEKLQRRQYSRIKIDNDIEIIEKNNQETKTNGWFIDISVGGFKMHLKTTLNMQKKYILKTNLDGKSLELEFKLISLTKDMENLYTASARFENISNTDKITLVQYCYRKQAENIEEK